MPRIMRVLATLLLIGLLGGCSDDVRDAVTNAQATMTVPTVSSTVGQDARDAITQARTSMTVPTVTLPTTVQTSTAPAGGVTVTASTQTVQRTTVSTTDSGSGPSSWAIGLIVVGGVLLLALCAVGIWRMLRPEDPEWREQMRRAGDAAYRVAIAVLRALAGDVGDRDWYLERETLIQVHADLDGLAGRARRRHQRDAARRLAAAVGALRGVLDARTDGGVVAGDDLVRSRAEDVVALTRAQQPGAR